MLRGCCLLWCFLIAGNYFAAHKTVAITTPQIPIKIVAHRDSALYLLSIRTDKQGKWEYYISCHSINTKSNFESCLQIGQLFDGKQDPYKLKYKIFACNNNIVFTFDVIINGQKTLIGKLISYDGTVSAAVVLDKMDMNQENLSECHYVVRKTYTKDISVQLIRTYKSGFQRDKCFLFSDRFEKIWEFELPKINAHENFNVIADIDYRKNLLYYVANYDDDIRLLKSKRVDSTTKVHVGYLDYDLKLRRDSMALNYIDPRTGAFSVYKIYYPFRNIPVIRFIAPSQIVLYNQVDLDDEKFISPAKKAIYYKRVDVKQHITLLDTLCVLSDWIQQGLTYEAGSNSKRPTNKNFRLSNEKIINGKLVSVFEHHLYESRHELLVSSFDISKNKLEWVNFIPRKTEVFGDLGDFFFSYLENQLTLSFYEHINNTQVTSKNYIFDHFPSAKNSKNSRFISWVISADGTMTKRTVNDKSAIEFIFPWLSDPKYLQKEHGAESERFFPTQFIYP